MSNAWFLTHERELSRWYTVSHSSEIFSGEELREWSDVLRMCKLADPEMVESEKLRHITKGIREDAFRIIVSRSASNLNKVTKLFADL